MFIVLEGPNGSGKSTIAEMLKEFLVQKGFEVEYKHFPDEKEELGKYIRKILTKRELLKYWEILGLLYAAEGNNFHLENLEGKKIRILDRHTVTSGFVYQKSIPWKVRKEIYGPTIDALKKKGVVINILTSAEVLYQRVSQRNEVLKGDKILEYKKDDKFLENLREIAGDYKKFIKRGCKKLGIKYFEIENNYSELNEVVKEKILQDINRILTSYLNLY